MDISRGKRKLVYILNLRRLWFIQLCDCNNAIFG